MRHLIRLAETIADDFALNQKIEAKFDDLPYDQALILDGLEIIKRESPQGIAVDDWCAKLRQINQDKKLSADFLRGFAKALLSEYNFCVAFLPESGTMRWRLKETGMPEIDPELAAAAGPQIKLTYMVLDILKDLGSFTERDALIAMAPLGLEPMMARGFLNHVMNIAGSSIEKEGDLYRFVPEKKLTAADHIAAMKNPSRPS